MTTLVFLKYPQPGRVKTRLARSLGAQAACALYRVFAEEVVTQARELGLVVCYDPCLPEQHYRDWLGPGRYWPQEGANLGERMAAALSRAVAYGPAVLVGTDSPQLDTDWLRRAYQALEDAEVVLGPAQDGGYYLVGVRGGVPGMFTGISWSTPEVLQQTLALLPQRRVRLLEATLDVDLADDLLQLEPLLKARPRLLAAVRRARGA